VKKPKKKSKMTEILENTNTIVSIISSIAIITASVFGGIWAYHTYINNENKAGLSVNISNIDHSKIKKDKYYLNINLNVKNIGNRELDVLLQKTNLKVFKLDSSQLSIAKIKDSLVFEITGRHTNDSNIYNSRMRSGVDYNFPYNIIIDEPGRYFIEFSITTDMNKYRSSFSRKTEPDTITWQDKAFYIVPKLKK
jgi:hypothetical protein